MQVLAAVGAIMVAVGQQTAVQVHHIAYRPAGRAPRMHAVLPKYPIPRDSGTADVLLDSRRRNLRTPLTPFVTGGTLWANSPREDSFGEEDAS